MVNRHEVRQDRAERFHRRVNSRISAIAGKIVDRTGLAITDAIPPGVAATMFPVEIFNKIPHMAFLPPIARTTEALAFATLMGVAAVEQVNHFRKPLSEKLGLEAREFSLQEEMEYVIDEVNQRAHSPALDFEELVPLAHDAVTDFLEGVDGYRTNSTRRVKQTRLLRKPLKKLNAIGLMNPSLREIVTTTTQRQELPAHEFAHAKGVAGESDAQVAGVLAQVTSGNESLQYVGYASWLRFLLFAAGYRPSKFEQQGMVEALQSQNLNSRTIDEITAEMRYFIENGYGSKFGEKLLDSKLQAMGQTDAMTAYVVRPAALLADHRRKQAA